MRYRCTVYKGLSLEYKELQAYNGRQLCTDVQSIKVYLLDTKNFKLTTGQW